MAHIPYTLITMTKYELYRDLARSLYSIALDAIQSHDIKQVNLTGAIIRSALDPLREILGEHTPVFELLEYLTPGASSPKPSDDWWDFSFDGLKKLKRIYPEVLGHCP
jgi:hypothetical protein